MRNFTRRFTPALVLAILILIQAAMLSPRALGSIGDMWAIATTGGGDVLRVTSAGDLVPGADNTYDLGSAALSFNDAHVQGTATIGTVSATNLDGILGANTAAAVTATTLTATGNVTMNDAGADTILIGAAADTVTITGDTSITDAQWSVTAAGAASFATLASGAAPAAAGQVVRATDLQLAAVNYAADAEASDAYVITLAPAPTAYAAGMSIHLKANTANTGACSVNVNALGVKAIKTGAGADPGDNAIAAGQIVHLIYDGTNFQLIQ